LVSAYEDTDSIGSRCIRIAVPGSVLRKPNQNFGIMEEPTDPIYRAASAKAEEGLVAIRTNQA
jgi:hypothetical protein